MGRSSGFQAIISPIPNFCLTAGNLNTLAWTKEMRLLVNQYRLRATGNWSITGMETRGRMYMPYKK